MRRTAACLMLGGLILGARADAPCAAADAKASGLLPAGLTQQLALREYEASPNAHGLQAPNRAHGLRTYFDPSGIRVHDRTAQGSPELLALTLSGVGRGAALLPVPPGEVAHEGTRVEIRRPGLVEWYLNTEPGLEQGFTLAERPAGSGELAFELRVGSARAELADGRVVFATPTGRRLEYGQLAVLDAAGRKLAARFEVPEPGRVRLVADDVGALYPLQVDPMLVNIADFTTSSNQIGARAGFAVASAGDVNADGYADVLVGAYLYDGGNTDEGRVWLYYGSASGVSAASPAVIESNQDNARLGISVASAGDVNSDRYADVLIGADQYSAGQSQEGAAFIFHGSATGIVASGTPGNANAQLESNQASSLFGTEVAGIGDVNGDGYADVAVGAPTYDAGENNEGAVFVFLGGALGVGNHNPSNAAATLQGNETDAQFGNGLDGTGDVNGDGYDDLIAGAPFYRTPDEGAAFVFLGSGSGIASAGAASASSILESNQTLGGSPQFGWAVAGAGDVNGDGYSDVIVGALTYDNGSIDEGVAFVFHGSATGIVASGNPGNANAILESDTANAYFGISVDGAGDVDGDGYADVIVGAFGYGGSSQGLAVVFRGGSSGIGNGNLTFAYTTLTGPGDATAQFGVRLAGAGDVNGDGYADVIVGAWLSDFGGSDAGAASVYHGGNRGVPHGQPPTANTLLERNQAGASFGYGLAGAGDVNGDGYADVIVGAFTYDDGQTDEGAAFVYHGGPTGFSSTPSSVLESNQAGAFFGYGVASAGDVNGDGYGDVIVGASNYDAGQTDEGAAFVFLGSSTGLGASLDPTNASTVIESNQANANLGYEVDGAGDVNGDGFADVIVGAPNYDDGQTDEGEAFVFQGSPMGISPSGNPSNANSVLQSNAAGTGMGYSATGVGDLNGDGYDDVAVGAVYWGNPEPFEGAVFVFHGGSGGVIANGNPGNANARFESNQMNGAAGSSVSTAGDVNGDGYADLITGASLYASPDTQEGAAFIFHGSSTGIVAVATPANANTMIQANQTSAFLGTVDAAGDVNGDGYGDVIVGATQFGLGGAGFVFLGSPTGVPSSSASLASARLEAAQSPFSAFASKVVGLGDVNGDGFSDVAVGAFNYDNGQTDEGAVFVFYGGGGHTGRPVVARQVNAFLPGPTPLQAGGLSGRPNQYRFEMHATSPYGRSKLQLVIESCATNVPFGHPSCALWVSGWGEVGPAANSLTIEPGIALLLAGTTYKWRARVGYAPLHAPPLVIGTPPIHPHGPWRRGLALAREVDVRTSFDFDGDGSANEFDLDDDADGLSDVDEIGIYGTNPLDADSDDDGLSDFAEVVLGSNPTDPDSDDDGDLDGADNCPFIQNADQLNGDPYAAGDACQCGDVTGDGLISTIDYTRARELVAGRTASGANVPERCDVSGDALCGVEDLAILDRLTSGAPAILLNSCPAYTTP